MEKELPHPCELSTKNECGKQQGLFILSSRPTDCPSLSTHCTVSLIFAQSRGGEITECRMEGRIPRLSRFFGVRMGHARRARKGEKERLIGVNVRARALSSVFARARATVGRLSARAAYALHCRFVLSLFVVPSEWNMYIVRDFSRQL